MQQGDPQPSPQREPKCYSLLVVLEQHKHQAENRDGSEETELEILSAVKKVVEIPVILSPGNDCDQQSSEHNQDTTNQSTRLIGAVSVR